MENKTLVSLLANKICIENKLKELDRTIELLCEERTQHERELEDVLSKIELENGREYMEKCMAGNNLSVTWSDVPTIMRNELQKIVSENWDLSLSDEENYNKGIDKFKEKFNIISININ